MFALTVRCEIRAGTTMRATGSEVRQPEVEAIVTSCVARYRAVKYGNKRCGQSTLYRVILILIFCEKYDIYYTYIQVVL